MNDITILYYTANLIPEYFASYVRYDLSQNSGKGLPIVSVSHKSIDFGGNICCSGQDAIPSIYNIYKQIMIGAKAARTKYVACCEDDCLYVPEHFEFIPPDDTFCYNTNHLGVDPNVGFILRHRMNMCMCISPTDLMIETLELRFEKYPEILPREKLKGFSEPGRHEEYLGLPKVKRAGFQTKIPCLTWNHRPSQGGIRKVLKNHQTFETNEFWGNGKQLWRKVHG